MQKKIGLYIHIPFCQRRCAYCDFVSTTMGEAQQAAYLKSLNLEIDSRSDHSFVVDTIFFGGGTPSILHLEQVEALLQKLKSSFNLCKNPEITIECNPESVCPKKLAGYLAAGINRISLGIQSLDDNELKKAGRIHTAAQALYASRLIAEAGFDNISCDIMTGLEGQTMASLNQTLDKILDMGIFEHISVYALGVEKGSALFETAFRPDDDFMAEAYQAAVQKLKAFGFDRYEISNFAKKGFECRHNLKYWKRQQYLGLGAGAHSFLNNQRGYNTSDVQKYIDRECQYVSDTVTNEDAKTEFIMLGLRLNEGLDLAEFEKQFGKNAFDKIRPKIDALVDSGCVGLCNRKLKINDSFVYSANQIILKLID